MSSGVLAARALAAELRLAVSAASEAGALLGSVRPGRVQAKRHALDWVTDVDLCVEQLLRDRLAVSGFPVLGEEGGGPGLSDGVCWVVDPVDGTVNFVMGNPLVGVNVALVDRSRVLVAATCLPFLGELYWAAAGGGAWCGSERLRADEGAGVGPVCLDVGDPVSDRLRPGALRRLGAASVEMAWCAAGKYAAVTYQVARPWDVACGVLLVQEAGGVVSGRAPGEDPMTCSLVAGHPVAVARVLEAVRG